MMTLTTIALLLGIALLAFMLLPRIVGVMLLLGTVLFGALSLLVGGFAIAILIAMEWAGSSVHAVRNWFTKRAA